MTRTKGTTLAAALGVLVCWGSGCSGGSPGAGAEGSAGGSADGPSEERDPVSALETGVPGAGLYCSLLVESECDGPEDCAEGQFCCGILNANLGLKYDSVRCEDECGAGRIIMCHEDEHCVDEGDICRRSTILPEFMTICGQESSLLPSDTVKPSTAAGEVNCGRELVCGENERCCVVTSWDAATQSSVPAPGLCAGVDEACDCANVTQREYTE